MKIYSSGFFFSVPFHNNEQLANNFVSVKEVCNLNVMAKNQTQINSMVSCNVLMATVSHTFSLTDLSKEYSIYVGLFSSVG